MDSPTGLLYKQAIMSPEPQPKRASYTGWFIGMAALLLLAAAGLIALSFCHPRNMIISLQGDPGGQVVWESHFNGIIQTGVTNLPAKLSFHGRFIVFTARRTNYSGPLGLTVALDESEYAHAAARSSTSGVLFRRGWDGWIVSETP